MDTDPKSYDFKKDSPRRCDGCIHFGELKGISGRVVNTVCLAPITTEPPPDSVTAAKHRFVYLTTVNGECELHTPNTKITQPANDTQPLP